MKKKITIDNLKKELKDFIDNKGFIPNTKDFKKHGLQDYRDYLLFFKDYKEILDTIKVEIPKEKMMYFSKFKNVTNEELLSIMRDYYENIGFPTQRKFKNSNGLPSYTLYISRFGSFKNAILMSGIDIPQERKRFFDRDSLSDEEMLSLLKYHTNKKLKDELYLITNDEIDSITSMPSCSTYISRFGSIVEAYKKIDIDYHEFNKQAMEKDMIDKYIELSELLGRTPTSRDITKYSKETNFYYYAMETYTNHFGSLTNTQIKAGMKPTASFVTFMTKNEIDELLIRYKKETGNIPTQRILDNNEDLPSSSYINKLYGGVRNMQLELFGEAPSKIFYSKKGTHCLSYFEKRLIDIFEDKNIQFEKEIKYKDVIKNFSKMYRFDFSINYKGKIIYIEMFGIEGIKQYDERRNEKIKLCKDNNLILIDLYPKDINKKTDDEIYKTIINKIKKVSDCKWLNEAQYTMQ